MSNAADSGASRQAGDEFRDGLRDIPPLAIVVDMGVQTRATRKRLPPQVLAPLIRISIQP